MIETTNKGDLIKLLIEMGRGAPHVAGLNEFFFKKERSLIIKK